MTPLQRRILDFPAEREQVRTEELMHALELRPPDFRREIEPLLEQRLVLTAVPTLGPGVWWITPEGRELVRGNAAEEGSGRGK